MSPQCLREGDRVARKRHYCDTCNAVIAPGDRHHVATNIFDGRVYDLRDCAACAEDRIVAEVWSWAGMPDDGIGLDDAHEWSHEMRDEDPRAVAWLARYGCRCEVCA